MSTLPPESQTEGAAFGPVKHLTHVMVHVRSISWGKPSDPTRVEEVI